MAIMRRAAEDEEEAEQRHAVAKARWDRRADAAATIHLELSRLQYLRPVVGLTADDAVHAKLAAAVVGCKEVIAAHAATTDAGLMQLVEQKLAEIFTSLQTQCGKCPPSSKSPPAKSCCRFLRRRS